MIHVQLETEAHGHRNMQDAHSIKAKAAQICPPQHLIPEFPPKGTSTATKVERMNPPKKTKA